MAELCDMFVCFVTFGIHFVFHGHSVLACQLNDVSQRETILCLVNSCCYVFHTLQTSMPIPPSTLPLIFDILISLDILFEELSDNDEMNSCHKVGLLTCQPACQNVCQCH